MKQVKPVVDYYVQTHFKGRRFPFTSEFSKREAIAEGKADFSDTGIKSKFRPVYKKEAL
jgi:hypothetical protein